MQLALHLAHRLLDAPVPGVVLAEGDRDPAVARLVDVVTAAFFSPGSAAPRSGPWAQMVRSVQFQGMDRSSDRLRQMASVLKPCALDWEVVPLPAWAEPAYYAVRVARLLRKHGAAAIGFSPVSRSSVTPDEPITRKALRALRLGRALRLVWNASPGAFVASAGLWVALGVLPPLTLLALKWLVDALAAPGEPSRALVAVALLGGLALLTAWCQSLSGFLGEAQGQRVADHVAEILHAKSLELDLEYYDDARYYDVLHRAQQEAPYRPFRVVSGLTRVAQGGLALAGTAGASPLAGVDAGRSCSSSRRCPGSW